MAIDKKAGSAPLARWLKSTFGCRRSRAVPLALALVFPAAGARGDRITIPADDGWRFATADHPGAESPGCDDSGWARVQVPHDWSIAGPFAENNPTGFAGGYLPSGVAWYRRSFRLPAAAPGTVWRIEFDGVMAHSEVWLNGVLLGKRPSGVVSFGYDLSSALRPGEGDTQILAVRTDTSQQPASRWYTGAGIYRHVRLIGQAPVHFSPASVFVTTPAVTAAEAMVEITGSVAGAPGPAEGLQVSASLYAMGTRLSEYPAVLCPGTPVAGGSPAPGTDTATPARSGANFKLTFRLARPDLWSPERPNLYAATVLLRDPAGRVLDTERLTFGIREARFAADSGFWINGSHLKLKGVCLHDDVSALGSAAPLAAWERRLRQLRALGANAIRTAHNPPDPGFLDLCDRLGFLVMDELFDVWTVAKEPYDYHLDFDAWSDRDERDTIRRDRNHPSVILWCVGNEIHDTPQEAKAKAILARLVRAAHETDPSRPVTQALFRPNVSHDYTNGLADLLDVVGTNYRYKELLAAHAARPSRRIVGTENGRNREQWLGVRDHAEYSGEFVWTGVDYLGEAHRWPRVGAGSGLIDRTAQPRASGWEFASWWSDEPMVKAFRRTAPPAAPQKGDPGYGAVVDTSLHFPQVLFADWTPALPGPHEETVEVYSNAETVRLELNGVPVKDALTGAEAEARPADGAPRLWHLPFRPGTLTAIALQAGRESARDVLRTAGPPARLQLHADRTVLTPSWEDVGYISATVVDAAGVPVPRAAPVVRFSLSGPGRIDAVDSADNESHESFGARERHAFGGKAWALVRATGRGPLVVTASAPGLGEASYQLNVLPAWTEGAGARRTPPVERVFSANAFGAAPDGSTDSTAAIQRAIDACGRAGGGTVTFAPGPYVTAALFLRDHVHLQVPAGVTLEASESDAGYPRLPTRVAGIEMSWPAALINVRAVRDVLIDGGGTIDGRGQKWWDRYWTLRHQYEPRGLRWAADYDAERVRLLVVSDSHDITVSHLHLRRSGFWTVHLLYSDHLTVDEVTISDNAGPSTDGIDVDSSRDVTISRCEIDNNDDDICLKSGRDSDGMRVNRPTENVFIHDNLSRRGGGLVSIGSETSGWIRHVVAWHNRGVGTTEGLRFKSSSARGGGAEDILIDDARLSGVPLPFTFTLDWNPKYSNATIPAAVSHPPAYWRLIATPVGRERGLAHFQNITIAHVEAEGARRIFTAEGVPDRPLGPVEWIDVQAEGRNAGQIRWTRGWRLRQVTLRAADGKLLQTADNDPAVAL